ncbi:MAG: cytochrome c [Pseudomonadota bacterium]
MRRLLITSLVVVLFGAGVFWWLTEPKTAGNEVISWLDKEGDVSKGKTVFWAGGCASCHASKDAEGDDKLLLGGNHQLVTPVGTFNVPNISPHPDYGIGSWTVEEFGNAMLFGTSPNGKHYYPAFPYTSYSGMDFEDIKHLWVFLKTLPSVETRNPPHSLSFPFNISRGTGLWKLLYLNASSVLNIDDDPVLKRGQYLVEVLGHCGECHTPRGMGGYGGLDKSNWLAGGPAPEGDGKIPNITPHESGIGSWSEDDIVYYLESGFTPDFDSVGGSMVSVQQNMAKLPKSDLEAIAQYLKAVPPVASN